MVGVNREAIMTTSAQHRVWIPGIRLGAAGVAMALAVVLGFGVVTTQSAQAQTFTTLYVFKGGTDGEGPIAGLVRDANGNLYGTTVQGGTSNAGTVFRLDTSGHEAVLYSFCFAGQTCPDGYFPEAGLVRDVEGDLYGTTEEGGAYGYGVVFKLHQTGKETVLYSFTGGVDGATPTARIVRDPDGNLFGTTLYGGTYGDGTVFKLDTRGKETVLHSFAGRADGAGPVGGLIRDANGTLYGTTFGGNGSDYGTVFKLSVIGEETVLYRFAGGTHGEHPQGGVVRDARGNLYGTTFSGGAFGFGAVFRVTRRGKETVLYSFAGGTDGAAPIGGLVRDRASNLYGTTTGGGTSGLGTVFKVDGAQMESVLHSFAGGADGEQPYGALIRDATGILYGTSFGCACPSDFGTVWKLTP